MLLILSAESHESSPSRVILDSGFPVHSMAMSRLLDVDRSSPLLDAYIIRAAWFLKMYAAISSRSRVKASSSEPIILSGGHRRSPLPGHQMESTRKKRKVFPDEDVFLKALPCAKQYQNSFMHRDTVTQVLASKSCVVTCSADGIVKIWQRPSRTGSSSSIGGSLEFAKSFRAHTGPITSAALSQDGTYLATISHSDTTLKIFDLPALDMVSLVKISEKHGLGPLGTVAWLNGSSFVLTGAESKIGLRWDSFDKSPKRFDLGGVITALAYSGEVLVAAYEDGSIGYLDDHFKDISPDPDSTHLLDCRPSDEDVLATKIFSIKFNEDSRFFAVSCSDRQLRVFRMATGRLYRKYDESLQVYNQLQASGKLAIPLDDMEFGKRMVVERDLDKANTAPFDAVFDESGTFLLYTTLLGVKVLNLLTNKVSLYLAASENLRFTWLALLKPSPDTVKNLELAASEHAAVRKSDEPLLALAAFRKNRFYLIGRAEPDSHMDRDVMNERATKEDAAVKSKATLPTQAIIRTTLGDIVIKLLPEVAPLAVENFTTHSKNGYYDNLIFHRIIKGFMVQTGDPLGDGTGGESIWGADFRDEINPDIKHDQPFTVSMANAGPGTNGSQFFITTVKCPWLDGKHTVFGRVVRGTEVVSKIEAVETDDLDKPKSDIKIIQIDTLS